MQTEPTLHDFVSKLLTDASARQAFDSDPAAALRAAGLSDVTPQDVVDAIPLVLDLASASGEGFAMQNGITGDLDGLAVGNGTVSPLGANQFGFAGGLDGVTGGTAYATDLGSGQFGFAGGTEGLLGGGTFSSDLGSGNFGFTAGKDGFSGGLNLHPPQGLDATGLDPDAVGRGGDAVTGTVAGYLTDGANTLAGALTEGAGALSAGLTGGAATTGGSISGGAAQLADAVNGPTTVGVPAAVPAEPSGLPANLPADLPAHLPTGGLPATPGLPGLGELPVDLPDLPVDLPPVDLPSVPAVPALPEAPSLPSLPGVDIVHDTVGGLTAQVPVVGDLTDGLDNHLPFGH